MRDHAITRRLTPIVLVALAALLAAGSLLAGVASEQRAATEFSPQEVRWASEDITPQEVRWASKDIITPDEVRWAGGLTPEEVRWN